MGSKASILMVAGERSGDMYGADLASALSSLLSGLEIFGCGGESMRRAGVDTVVDSHQVSIVGITEVVEGLPRAYRAFKRIVEEVDRRRPQLAILIDFPSFNLRLAKKLKKRNIPVVYFISPQIWAWKGWRIKEIKAQVTKMICIFEFEEEIYRKAGVPVEYVGHPLVDLVRPHLTREEFQVQAGLDLGTPTIALLPGSRKTEVSYNLPAMLDATSRLAINRNIQFVVAVAPEIDPAWLESMLARCYVGRARVRTVAHATYDTLQHCDVAIVASGTATVEAALREKPMVVVYRVSPVTWLLGKFLVHVPFYCMVNLLAGKKIVPELIQNDFTGQNLESQVRYLLDDQKARSQMVEDLRALKASLGPGGAIQKAAVAAVGVLRHSEVMAHATEEA